MAVRVGNGPRMLEKSYAIVNGAEGIRSLLRHLPVLQGLLYLEDGAGVVRLGQGDDDRDGFGAWSYARLATQDRGAVVGK